MFGSDPVTIYEDVSRNKNVCTGTSLDYEQLASGLWVPSFNGSAYVTVTDAPCMNLSTQMMVSAWIRKDDLTGAETVISKYTAAGNKGEWLFGMNIQKLRIAFGNASTGAYSGTWQSTNNVIIAADTWYHVGFTFDAGTVALYVNGVSVAGGVSGEAIPVTFYNGTANMLIGAYEAGATDPFSGNIDGSVIYGYVADTPADFMKDGYNEGAGLYGLATI